MMQQVLRTHGTTVGRILIGLLFFFSGVGILMGGISGTSAMIADTGLPMAALFAWLVVLVKIGAGGALMAGYKVEKAALLLIGFTILTILAVHRDLQDINLFKNLSIIGGLLYVYTYGSSKDSWKI